MDALFGLYDDLGFPRHLGPDQLPAERVAEMAPRAVPDFYAPRTPEHVDAQTPIAAPAVRTTTVANAAGIFCNRAHYVKLQFVS